MLFQSLTPLAVLMLASTARACLQFGASLSGDGTIAGAILDNGQTTCTINTNRNNPGIDNEFWFTCPDSADFAAFLSNDLGTLAYSNRGNNLRFAVANNGGALTVNAFC